jgi:hypothetical protein
MNAKAPLGSSDPELLLRAFVRPVMQRLLMLPESVGREPVGAAVAIPGVQAQGGTGIAWEKAYATTSEPAIYDPGTNP